MKTIRPKRMKSGKEWCKGRVCSTARTRARLRGWRGAGHGSVTDKFQKGSGLRGAFSKKPERKKRKC